MEAKVLNFSLRGMQRDLSRSKFSPEFSYENKNVRIVSQGDGTLFSIVNERGQSKITLRTKQERLYNIKVHGTISERTQSEDPIYNILVYGNVYSNTEEENIYNITISGTISENEPEAPTVHSITIHGDVSYDDSGSGETPMFEFEKNTMRIGRRKSWAVVRYLGNTDNSVVFTHNLPSEILFEDLTGSVQIRSNSGTLIPVGTYTINAAYKGLQRSLLIIVEDWYLSSPGLVDDQIIIRPGQTVDTTIVTGPGISASSILSGTESRSYSFVSLPYVYDSTNLAFSITRVNSNTIRFSCTRNASGNWGTTVLLSTDPNVEDRFEPYYYFGASSVLFSMTT